MKRRIGKCFGSCGSLSYLFYTLSTMTVSNLHSSLGIEIDVDDKESFRLYEVYCNNDVGVMKLKQERSGTTQQCSFFLM